MHYFLETKFSSKRSAYILNDLNTRRTEVCGECGGNFVRYGPPVHFDIKGELCDFYGADNLLFISQKFLDLIRAEGLSGWTAEKTNVNSWNKADDTPLSELGYYHFAVTGRCGLVCDTNGEELFHCKVCGRRLPGSGVRAEGLAFKEENYDGSDIFAFDNWDTKPIVTERVKKLLTKAKLTNLKFTPLTEKVLDERIPPETAEMWLKQGRVSDELKAYWDRHGVLDKHIRSVKRK